MKKSLLTFTLLLIVHLSYAQWSTSAGNTTTTDNVGIGTTNPALPLEVAGGAAGVTTNILQLRSNATATSTGTGIRFVNSTSSSNTGTGGELKFIRNATSGSSFVVSTAYSGVFNDRLALNEDGFLGLGTTNPNAAIDVQRVPGSAGMVPRLNLMSYVDGSGFSSRITLGKSRGTTIGNYSATSSGDAFGGLEFSGVNSSSATALGAQITAYQDGSAGATYVPTRMSFFTGTDAVAAAERMTIKSTGNVGIGTTSPLSLLHVNGEITASTNNNGYGRTVIAKNVSQPDGYRYLLLVKQEAGGSIAGTITGKRQDNSDFGTNSVNMYVNIRANNGGSAGASLVYWEADVAGSTSGTGTATNAKLVTVTYGGEVWYAVDAVFDATTHRLFQIATFTGNVGSAVFTWVTAASVSGIAFANSNSLKNWGGRMVMSTAGRIGISTTDPQNTLHVASGTITANTEVMPFRSSNRTLTGGVNIGYFTNSAGTDVQEGRIRSTDVPLAIGTTAFPQAIYLLNSNGNVGIGTIIPDAKLAVNGIIHTKEVKVDLTGWSDYVFKPSYKLPTLAQVDAFINKNGHLPDIPSASEVERNGVMLGEMNKLLLKKIEELTLYLIDQNKKIETQQHEIEAIKKHLKKKSVN